MSNIVIAAPGKNNKTTTRPLYQWDYGQILKFEGFSSLPEQYVVHFSNQSLSGDAVERLGDANGVDIPDALLQTGLPVYAWLYQHTGDADGESIYLVTIPVMARPRPTDQEATPQQVDAVDRAIQELNGAVDEAQAAQTAAEAAAQVAQSAAAGVSVYEFTAEIYQSNTLLSEARAADVIAAYDAGSAIRGRLLVDGKYYELYLSGVRTQDGKRWIFLSSIVEYSQFTKRYEVVAKEGNTYLTWFEHSLSNTATQFIIRCLYSNNTITADRALSEISNAYNRGEQVVVRLNTDNFTYATLPLVSYHWRRADNPPTTIIFSTIVPQSASLAYCYTLQIAGDSASSASPTWTYTRTSVSLTT